ncbi:MAG: hypothetical protein AB7L65_09450 [Hyphomonadaceae bacterium]
MKRLFFSLAVLSLAAGASVAQTPPAPAATAAPAPRPPARLAAPQRDITAAIAQLETTRFGACAGEDRAVARLSGGESRYRLASERRMRDGGVKLYRYAYRVTGCGRPPRRHNVEIYVHEGLAPMILTLPIGTTALTTNVLQGVFDSLLTPMMRARYPSCEPRRLKILEANMLTGAAYVRGQPWTERWRYDACGGEGVADISFTYDGEGLSTEARVTPDGAEPPPTPPSTASGAAAPAHPGPLQLDLPHSRLEGLDPARPTAGPPN